MDVKKRDMKLSDYHISRARYNELKYFCMQYYEKKQKLAHAYSLPEIKSDGQPKGNLVGNPTESQAIDNMKLQKEIELIEQTAKEADEEISEWLLMNVTEGIAYEYLDVPKNRTDFYSARKYFFYLLSLKK